MLQWAFIFLVLAIIAGAFGFGGVAGTSMAMAKILFLVFLALFIISAVMHVIKGKKPLV